MNMKRMRGRNHRNGQGPQHGGGGGGGQQIRPQGGNIPLNRNHVFDSSGPDLRIRGTAQQLFEKYLQLGRDATSGGDRVMAESYFQHAEHYFRILNAMAQAVQQGQSGNQNAGQSGGQSSGQNGGYNGNQQRQRPHENNGPEASGQDGEGDEPDAGQQQQNRHQQGGHQQGSHHQGGHQNGQHQQVQAAGLGDQPGGDTRDIPIGSNPPDA